MKVSLHKQIKTALFQILFISNYSVKKSITFSKITGANEHFCFKNVFENLDNLLVSEIPNCFIICVSESLGKYHEIMNSFEILGDHILF